MMITGLPHQLNNSLFDFDDCRQVWLERVVNPLLPTDDRRRSSDPLNPAALWTLYGSLCRMLGLACALNGGIESLIEKAKNGDAYLALATQSRYVKDKDYSGGLQGYLRREFPKANSAKDSICNAVATLEAMGVCKKFSNGQGNVPNYTLNPVKAIALLAHLEELLGIEPQAHYLEGDEQLSATTLSNQTDTPLPKAARWLANVYKTVLGGLPNRAKEITMLAHEVQEMAIAAWENLTKALIEVRNIPAEFTKVHQLYCRRWVKQELPECEFAFLASDYWLNKGDPVTA